MSNPTPMRLAKALAHRGFCSRRQADAFVKNGAVTLNGRTHHNPATLVLPHDDVRLNHQPPPKSPAQTPRLFLLHKPRGILTSADQNDPRPVASALIPKGLPRLVFIGRLDMYSEGLLLATDSPTLAHYLERPENAFLRVYHMRVFGAVTPHALRTMLRGILINRRLAKPLLVEPLKRQTSANTWIAVHLAEGKNREVRRLADAAGLQVNRLVRVQFGPFHLGSLPRGSIHEIPRSSLLKRLPNIPS